MTLDEDLLESLYYRYSQRMENFAAHLLGESAAARDVVQDSFIKFYRKYQGKDEQNYAPLLFTILRNGCKDALRRRLARGKIITADLSSISESEKLYSAVMQYSHGDSVLYDELVKEVGEVLSRLSGRCRDIFMMSRLEGMKNREIASRLGITEQAVKNQISKALKAFREALSPWGAVDTGLFSAIVLFVLLG